MQKLAKIVSVIFHPIFIPLYTILIIFNLDTYFAFIIDMKAKLIILGFVTITTILLPVITLFIMKKLGMITSLKLENREERLLPYLMTGGYFFLAYYTIKGLQLPNIYPILFLGSAILIFLTMLINFFWKISSHTMAMGGITGIIIGIALNLQLDLLLITILIILISGITASARLILQAHSSWQIYAGYALGLIGFLAIMQLIL